MDNSCQKVLLWPLNAQRIHKHSRKRNNNSRHLQNFICISFVYIQYTHTHTRESEQKKERKKKERKLRIVVEKKTARSRKERLRELSGCLCLFFASPTARPCTGRSPLAYVYIYAKRAHRPYQYIHTQSHTHTRVIIQERARKIPARGFDAAG